MTANGRREFLKLAAGSTFAASAGAQAIAKALAVPAHVAARSIRDVEHVVILMQENRSFDHYFGALRGVRGFGDPRPLTLPGGKPVWRQPDAKRADGYVLPFRLDGQATRAQLMDSLDHSWKGSHERWKHHDAWVAAKTPMTMGHFTRDDLPFYYALADAFTVCDAYHCSIFGPTNPNRMFLFTGTSGLSAGETGPLAVNNPWQEPNETAEMGHDNPKFAGLGWTTYAERLQAAGVSWKVYQEYDNYGDNALAFCRSFRDLDRASPLYHRGRDWVAGSTPGNAKSSRGEHLVAAFARDVAAGALPQVSWIVAPYIMCEHPSASPGYGQALTTGLLEALAEHPEVWSKTVFILNYDENDGFFDHMPPPLPATGAALGASNVDLAGEAYDGQPVGLGPRVPMIAISPWSRGGWVNSQVFDHTSVIRFLEARFGVEEPNINAWRRAVCGDLSSVFDFKQGGRAAPARLSGPSGMIAQVDATAALPAPAIPSRQAMPTQEPGGRPARALPYRLQVHGVARPGGVGLTFVNDSEVGAPFSVWAADASGPWFYTVAARSRLVADLPTGPDGYDLTVHGPNGLLRRFAGGQPGGPEIEVEYQPRRDRIAVAVHNPGPVCHVTVSSGVYGHGPARVHALDAGQRMTDVWRIDGSAHWYDLIMTSDADPRWLRRLSGHMETGRPSISDPALG
jgi:phospholipase C